MRNGPVDDGLHHMVRLPGFATATMRAGAEQPVEIALDQRPFVIDSASVKAAETVGAASRGYDAGKKITAGNVTSPSMASSLPGQQNIST